MFVKFPLLITIFKKAESLIYKQNVSYPIIMFNFPPHNTNVSMPLFQKSVLAKYSNELDKTVVNIAYDKFKSYFGNLERQENIRNSKEEQFQEGFLNELFVKILGYTLNPNPDFNLTTEYKNVKDSKKADGAILIKTVGATLAVAQKVIAVIELKGTDTTDLGKIENQAFGYKNNQPECIYVITSNFEKLRFYIDNAIDFEEFNLFNLTFDKFEILYLCLAYQNIEKGIPKKIKDESLSHEDVITKKLYNDYSLFKRELYQNLTTLNPQFNAITLYTKSQKLLDRFLFLFFAEDRLLLPPNSVKLILNDWRDLQERDEKVPLYNRYKKYFEYLNTGFKGKRYDVFAYNGGLFKPDEILDTIIIDDELLYKHTKKLSDYDFQSEIDVNILGHIFENSLNELDEIKAQLEGREIDKSKTKRKKDGVFYTPKYITKYIVDNTIGKLCTEKKAELNIIEEEYITDKKRQKKTRQLLSDKLTEYRNWLLHLTICDPACGSGAFLNQALNFLIAEHHYIDELTAKLFGDSIVLSDIENTILENNLFGVDLNEESVEIARLSLWLRTAHPNRKLNDLSNNIKCGNSLISDPVIAGDKAFDWFAEFPQVFPRYKNKKPIENATSDDNEDENSIQGLAEPPAPYSYKEGSKGFEKYGFDVIIGNPPYVDIKELPENIVEYLFKKYKTANNRINLFSVFMEKAFEILKVNGKFSFIIPSSLLTQESYKLIRNKILSKSSISNIVRLPNESFGGGAGEVKVDTIIFTFTLSTAIKSSIEVLVYKGYDRIDSITQFNCDEHIYIDQSLWANDENYIFRINVNDKISNLLSKIENETGALSNCADFCLGLTPYDKYKGHTQEQINNRVFHSSFKKDETYKMLLAGNDITRYNIVWNGEEWISYGKWLGAPRDERFFKEKRILVKQIIDWTAKRIWAAMTDEELYNTQNAFNLIAKHGFSTEYLLILINSSLMSFYHKKKFLEEYKDRFQKILIKDCKNFPIKPITLEQQQPFIEKADLMLSLNKEFHIFQNQFTDLLKSKYGLEKLSTKLQYWYSLEFKDFLKELEKVKVKFLFSQQADLMNFFNEQKQKAQSIKSKIEKTDKEIDKMVYALYDLTNEEIKIIEEIEEDDEE